MREIKFRAWDKTRRCWNYSVDAMELDADGILCTSDNYEVMQYTGLKDKNGVEIYEGDIVKWRYMNNDLVNEVLFLNGCFVVGGIAPIRLSDLQSYDRELEVIGNIWENGDLLK